MASTAVELLGFYLALMGLVGTLVVMAVPSWKTSAFISPNIVTAVSTKKGLWMECVYQSTGTFQCETYNSMLALPSDLQAARAMMVISIVFSFLGCGAANLGLQCTVFMQDTLVKTKVAGVAGGCFLLGGFFCMVPVSWITHEVVQTFYQPTISNSLKYELGECLYAGLASALLSMLGGSLLCMSCCSSEHNHSGGRGVGMGYPYPGRTGGLPRTGFHGVPVRHSPPKGSGPTQGRSGSSSESSAHNQTRKSQPHTNYGVTGYV